MEDQVKFELPVWDRVSVNCKKLVSDLLTKDQSKRISLD
jgi:hypothetical protein